jgi:hypothetical protein
MDGKDVVYGLGIVLTFALGLWNLFFNYRNTRRTNFINTVTLQRVKWLEQIRQRHRIVLRANLYVLLFRPGWHAPRTRHT